MLVGSSFGSAVWFANGIWSRLFFFAMGVAWYLLGRWAYDNYRKPEVCPVGGCAHCE